MATLVEAAAMAEVVETTTEPAGSVEEIVTGMITAVEEVDGGGLDGGGLDGGGLDGGGLDGGGLDGVVSEFVVAAVFVVEVEVGAVPFCLLIRSRAATASNLVANGGLTECTASMADLSCSYTPSWYFGCNFSCKAAWIDCSGRASSSSWNSSCLLTGRSDGSG